MRTVRVYHVSPYIDRHGNYREGMYWLAEWEKTDTGWKYIVGSLHKFVLKSHENKEPSIACLLEVF